MVSEAPIATWERIRSRWVMSKGSEFSKRLSTQLRAEFIQCSAVGNFMGSSPIRNKKVSIFLKNIGMLRYANGEASSL